VIKGVPAGIGEPVYGKLQSALAAAMLSINAVKGFDFGDGFDAPLFKGSEHNDEFFNDNGRIATHTNHSGGIQGGISNGQDIYFRVAFKATATILRQQETVDIQGNDVSFKARGRHDPCVIPRAVPIVESMAAIVIADYMRMAGKV
jgi:chorismate synthase